MKHTACRSLWLKLFLLVVAMGIEVATAQQPEVVQETGKSRTVKHALGETQIPAHPQRIVSLRSVPTDGLLALGVVPVEGDTYTGTNLSAYEYGLDALEDIAGEDEYEEEL